MSFEKEIYKMTASAYPLQPGSNYGFFKFANCNKPVDGKLNPVNGPFGCRDEFGSSVRKILCGKSPVSLETDKTRMLFFGHAHAALVAPTTAVRAEVEPSVLRGSQMIRACDRIAGWPLTKIYKVKAEGRNWLRAYYTVSSRRWMKSPYLATLYILLMRAGRNEAFSKVSNFDSLYKIIADFYQRGRKFDFDNQHLEATYTCWEALLRGYPSLFQKHKMAYYWHYDRTRGPTYGEGISRLCSFSTRNKEAREELFRLKKKFDAEKKNNKTRGGLK